MIKRLNIKPVIEIPIGFRVYQALIIVSIAIPVILGII
jgi:hypothetical protein